MPKKYIVRTFNPNKKEHKRVNPLINLSSLGINTQANIIKTSLSIGNSETSDYNIEDSYYAFGNEIYGQKFNKYRDITNTPSQTYAFFDTVYSNRREYLRAFAQSNEINFVLDTIANEAIIPDENGYFVQLDLDRLKLHLHKNYKSKKKNDDTDALIRDCKIAFETVYSQFGWDKNNNGWNYFKKFLIDGFLAFEIIFDNVENPTRIEAFKELDPVTLEPEIHTYDGKDFWVWYQYRGDAERERIIPDANIIYISWTSMNFAKNTRVSYLEGLTRSFNMLRQLENAKTIWNIQNSSKRIKITVPVGAMTDARAQQRVSEIIADYNEEVTIDDASGEVIVNGEPKFSFSKTYVFPQRDGGGTDIEEMGVEGYDMSSIEPLKYWWRRFIMETQIPANRFMLDVSGPPANQFTGDANITREEYQFARFIHRVQAVFKEIIMKPLWIQLCLMHPELTTVNFLRSCLGLIFNEENLFTLAKKRAAVNDGTQTVGSLMQIMKPDNTPYFSIDWVIKEYLGLSDVDLDLNRKYMEAAQLEQLNKAKQIKDHQAIAQEMEPMSNDMQAESGGFGGMDSGGVGSMENSGFNDSSGNDFGGSDFGGADTNDFGGSDMGDNAEL